MVIDTLNLEVPVPCIQGHFGKRLVSYTTQVPPRQLLNILGHDPRSQNWKRLPDDVRGIYEYLQRKTDKNRREGVAGYIEERFGPDSIAIGAFPAISIAFQSPTPFTSYTPSGGAQSGPPSAVGFLKVDISPANVRVLVDGLARVTGALDLVDHAQGELLETFSLPLTIYAPAPGTKQLTWREMGQLFHDFNFRVQPVSKQHAIALDTSDLYIALAMRFAECAVIKDNGGVAERSASLGKKSTELVVQTVLVRTIRGACEGRKFQEADLSVAENPNLTTESMKAMLNSINEFFEGIYNRMGKDRFTNRSSLHLSAPGWQALGVIHHDVAFKLKLDAVERVRVLEKIGAIDWSRANPDWLKLGIGHQEVDKKTGQFVLDDNNKPKIALSGAGRTNAQALIDYVREKAGIAGRLALIGVSEAEAA